MATHHLVPRALRRAPYPSRRLVIPELISDFDRVLDAFMGGAGHTAAPQGATVFAPPLDYSENDAEIRVAAELPGLEEQDIRVSLEEGVLTIEGERASEHSEEDDQGFRHVESVRGHFRRAVRLGSEVDENAIVANYKNGVLTVTLPKLAEPSPEVRTIPVTSS